MRPSTPPRRPPTPRVSPSSARGRKPSSRTTARVMDLAGYRDTLSRDRDTLLKLNLSWTKYFPSCSSQPWQVDGVAGEDARATDSSGDRLIPIENKTVVTNPREGCRNNRWESVLDTARADVHAASRRRVAGLPVQEPAAEAERHLPGRHPDPGDLSGPADRASADGEDTRPRGDDRLGEELLRRAAAGSPALRAQVHARGAGRPALHAARAASRRLHRDGRHGRGRRRRTADDDSAHQEPAPGGGRLGGHRRDRRAADGLRSAVDPVPPDGPRTGPRHRRPAADRARRRRRVAARTSGSRRASRW